MEKVFIAQRVANKLHATEASVDAALVEAAEMMNELVKARQELKLSATFAQESTAKLVDAMKALGEARAAMMVVHSDLNEAQLRLGIRTRMDLIKPLAREARETTVLREVG